MGSIYTLLSLQGMLWYALLPAGAYATKACVVRRPHLLGEVDIFGPAALHVPHRCVLGD